MSLSLSTNYLASSTLFEFSKKIIPPLTHELHKGQSGNKLNFLTISILILHKLNLNFFIRTTIKIIKINLKYLYIYFFDIEILFNKSYLFYNKLNYILLLPFIIK